MLVEKNFRSTETDLRFHGFPAQVDARNLLSKKFHETLQTYLSHSCFNDDALTPPNPYK
jgi:hypothetical protein